MPILVEKDGPITIISIDRPEVRNCVNPETAEELAAAWREFDADSEQKVGVFAGVETGFCAGFDLKAVAAGDVQRTTDDSDGPMGPSRMLLSKPVVGAISGHAVAGGLELALWCDMRVAEEDAILGVYCRRWGVPLIDGGTIRLPRLIGLGHAMDMILTGRGVPADEALRMGLVNRVVPKGAARDEAIAVAHGLCKFPQFCMNSDRLSAYEQFGMSLDDAILNEFHRGKEALKHGTREGATRFAEGKGRGGDFGDI
ncbi:MAG: crotonase/enoyl-CoA hydratase family protein [Candidatus Hydrogenedentota bacterium]